MGIDGSNVAAPNPYSTSEGFPLLGELSPLDSFFLGGGVVLFVMIIDLI